MLEDTQLAKNAFYSQDNMPSIGILYLHFYGVLNAVYMQQQALLVLLRKMRFVFDSKEIKNCKVFDIRNSFAAHGANRGGRDIKEHSFILDRNSLRMGKVSGYSANHKTGFMSHDYKIKDLLDEWDLVLIRFLLLIHEKVSNHFKKII